MERFSHPLIRLLISDFTPADSQASSFVMAYGNFLSGDGGIPAGGSRAMAFRMAKTVRWRQNCHRKSGAKNLVDQAKGQADGVLLADGTEVFCDYVVPACDMSVTFGRLLPREKMGSLLRQMYDGPAGISGI